MCAGYVVFGAHSDAVFNGAALLKISSYILFGRCGNHELFLPLYLKGIKGIYDGLFAVR